MGGAKRSKSIPKWVVYSVYSCFDHMMPIEMTLFPGKRVNIADQKRKAARPGAFHVRLCDFDEEVVEVSVDHLATAPKPRLVRVVPIKPVA